VTPGSGAPFELRLSVPRHALGSIDPGTTPFLPIAAVLAGFLGEDLEVEAPVSPVAAVGAESALRVMHDWWSVHHVRIEGPREPPPYLRGEGTGLLYTRGVDSTFSLVRHRSGEQQPPPTHLIGITGLDHWIGPATREGIWIDTVRAAERVGLPLLRVHTEVRAVLDPVVDWLQSHGAVLASAALLYAPVLGTAVIGSSQRADLAVPLGSHPELDHRWGSERCSLVHDGADHTRLEKVARIAREPELLADLKVCWRADSVSNCGRCYKCLLTMTALAAAGVPTAGTFEETLSREAIRASELGFLTALEETVNGLPDDMADIRDAWVERVHEEGLRMRADPDDALELLVPSETGALCTPDPVATLAEVAAGAGVVVVPDPSRPARDVYGWVPGRVPLRLPRDATSRARQSVAELGSRAVPWCLVDHATPETVALAERLTDEWGEGICYLAGVPFAAEQPPGLPSDSVAALLRTSRARVWWCSGGDLDAVRLYESVANGCVPLQAMPTGTAELLRPLLPVRLRAVLLAVGEEPLPTFDLEDLESIRAAATAELVTGSLERDHLLAMTAESTPREARVSG